MHHLDSVFFFGSILYLGSSVFSLCAIQTANRAIPEVRKTDTTYQCNDGKSFTCACTTIARNPLFQTHLLCHLPIWIMQRKALKSCTSAVY